MRKDRLLKVLLRPHVSEKASYAGAGHPQYAFEVAKDANKHEIKVAVEQLFNVKVSKVRIVNMKGARAMKFGRKVGKFSSWKKAYVVLKDGQQINVA